MPRTPDGFIIGKRDLRPIFAELERERRVLVIFDACFSGKTVRSLRGDAGFPGMCRWTPVCCRVVGEYK